jgi:hypothetical protein
MKIKFITLAGDCDSCRKHFESTADKIEHGYYSCDCDYPCGCKNGPQTYVNLKCPHCGKINKVIINDELDK